MPGLGRLQIAKRGQLRIEIPFGTGMAKTSRVDPLKKLHHPVNPVHLVLNVFMF